MNQSILPAISNMKHIESFIKSDLEYCILMNCQLETLQTLCNLVHAHGKKCFVHVDLIKGIANDGYGASYLCQVFKLEGLISTHASVIEVAKKHKKIAILRIFLIDTMSLSKSIDMSNKIQPDYIELLPAIAACQIIAKLQAHTQIPLIGGGLIETSSDIDKCLQLGIQAITTSNTALWQHPTI